ncbi:MAG: NAD-binding protein [Candidatus Micrarchaeota archaeon]|nr:NAD-binding protein [Candidatus Micrarchaeota archaeon]
MVSVKRTKQLITMLVIALLIVSVALKVSAGLTLQASALDTAMSGLQMDYIGIPMAAADNWQVGAAKLLDALVLPLLALLIAISFVGALAGFDIREKVTRAKIRNLRRHAILVPFNSYAEELAAELSKRGIKSVVLAKTKKGLTKAMEAGLIGVVGDIDEPETFSAAGIASAEFVVACDYDDMKNAITAITARSKSASVKVISVVNDSENQDKMMSLKIDAVVAPELSAGQDIADEIVKNAFVRSWRKEA